MEITSFGVGNAPVTPQSQVEASSASGTPSASSITPSPSTYTPSAELTRLLEQVRNQPEVRSDRVQAAAARLQQGYYNCQAGIEQTAQAMSHVGARLQFLSQQTRHFHSQTLVEFLTQFAD